MTNVTKYFKEQNEELIFTGNYCEVYIPYFYIENELFSTLGDVVKVYGLFCFKVSDTEIERKANMKTNLFKFPSYMYMTPTGIEKKVTIQLNGDSKPEDYLVLKFNKGSKFMNSLCIAASSDSIIDFVKMMSFGKIPKSIPYDKVLDVWLNNLAINNGNLGVSSVIFELFIAEIYRYKKDESIAFRFKAGKNPEMSMYDYNTINLKQLANLNSTFTALTFEDADLALANAVNKSIYNEKEVESPIEKIIKY
jgi:hypothetical protein